MKALAIAQVGLIRLLREKANLFSMFVLPIVLVFVLGTQFGDRSEVRIAVAGPAAVADPLVRALERERGIAASRVDDVETVRDDAQAGRIGLGVVLPADAATALREGSPLRVRTYSSDGGDGPALEPVVAADDALVPGVARWLREQADAGAGSPGSGARAGADPTGSGATGSPGVDGAISAAAAEAAARRAAADVPRTQVSVASSDGREPETGGRYGDGAAQQLVLLVFLLSLLSATTLAQNLQLGVIRRILSTPTSAGTIVVGEAATRWLVAMVQGVYIVVATALLFGVDWGSLPLTALLLVAFAAVGAGAGMLLGAVVADEMLVVGIALLLGLALGALGGAMLPRELFTPTLSSIADFTPHAWALEGLSAVREGDGLSAIAAPLAVLAGAAAVLLALAAWRLRVRISRV